MTCYCCPTAAIRHRGVLESPENVPLCSIFAHCARSSAGQSSGLLIRGSQVRILPGALQKNCINKPNSSNREASQQSSRGIYTVVLRQLLEGSLHGDGGLISYIRQHVRVDVERELLSKALHSTKVSHSSNGECVSSTSNGILPL